MNWELNAPTLKGYLTNQPIIPSTNQKQKKNQPITNK
jgi:hypothetical protein